MHQFAQAQLENNAKLTKAFGIYEYFVGTSFDPNRKWSLATRWIWPVPKIFKLLIVGFFFNSSFRFNFIPVKIKIFCWWGINSPNTYSRRLRKPHTQRLHSCRLPLRYFGLRTDISGFTHHSVLHVAHPEPAYSLSLARSTRMSHLIWTVKCSLTTERLVSIF